ncbi:helix-turn-helix transcriptional regulator [Planctomycetaceae bacterium SH139]
MARNEQLVRQHRILQLLEETRYGKTLDDIREDLVGDMGLTSLHGRTVRRDIEALQVAGYDIVTEQTQRGKVWKMGRTDRGIHSISASATELIALSIGRDLLYPLVGTSYWQGIESFWNKVREVLPDGVYEHYQRYRKTLCVFGTPSRKYESKEGILRTINRAISEHRVVEIVYQSVGKPETERQIEPYGLAVYQSSIYVVAAASEVTDPEERLRHWKLDRFQKAILTDQYFRVDPSVDLESHLGKSIGIFSGEQTESVIIRLGQRAAGWVREDPWHPDQILQPEHELPEAEGVPVDEAQKAANAGVPHIDAATWLFTVPAAHPRELLPKVLALGSDAEVLEPASFRTAVQEVVGRLAATYRVTTTPAAADVTPEG